MLLRLLNSLHSLNQKLMKPRKLREAEQVRGSDLALAHQPESGQMSWPSLTLVLACTKHLVLMKFSGVGVLLKSLISTCHLVHKPSARN